MRESYYDKRWIINGQGQPYGVNMGYDHCAEHEWGIKGIQRSFGVGNLADVGVQSRQITQVPDAVQFFTFKKTASALVNGAKTQKKFTVTCLRFAGHDRLSVSEREQSIKKDTTWRLRSLLRKHRAGDELVCQWDDSELQVLAIGEAESDYLREIHEAMMRKDLIITVSGRANPFAGTGLHLIIASRIPEDVRRDVLANDLDHQTLQQKARESGVDKHLELIGVGYNCLVPRWADEAKTDVTFYINPSKYNSTRHIEPGWYSRQQLLDLA